MSIFNRFVILVLTSPFHGVFHLSRTILLLTVQGHKSGNLYTFPVEYVQEGDRLFILSQQQRVWWKNLLDGAPVRACLRGKVLPAQAMVKTNPPEIAAQLEQILLKRPYMARGFNVRREGTGFNAGDLHAAAHNLVAIELNLAVEPVVKVAPA